MRATAPIAPTGLATPFPAYFGAEPWIGSNIDTFPGWMFPEAAAPRPPLRAAVLGVLAHHEATALAAALVIQRARALVVAHDRPQVYVQVESAATADEHVALHEPARHARVAERAEEDRVEGPEPVDHLGR